MWPAGILEIHNAAILAHRPFKYAPGTRFFPMRFITNILQLRFMEAGVEFSRFMMNMMGSAGLVDLSANKKDRCAR